MRTTPFPADCPQHRRNSLPVIAASTVSRSRVRGRRRCSTLPDCLRNNSGAIFVETGNEGSNINNVEPTERQAFISILRAAELIRARFERLLKSYGLTEPQFNVLRIVRGAGRRGLPSQDIGKRMITRVPDVTRLLERLEQKGLVTRTRSEADRRVVLTRLTPDGRKLLSRLDEPVDECHRQQFGHLTGAEQQELIRLLATLSDK